MAQFLESAFKEGAFIRRAVLVWAMLVATAVLFFICKLIWIHSTPENVQFLTGILITPVTLLVGFLSGSYNKWGSARND